MTGVQTCALPIWQVIRKVIGVNSSIDDSAEPVRYRTAVLGILAGMVFLVFFCNHMGMSLWVLGLYSIIYLFMVLGIARARAEVGPPLHSVILIDPGKTLVSMIGTRRLGVHNLSSFTLLYPFNRCYRANPFPSQLEGLRLAERSGIHGRKLIVGMVIAIVFGVFVTFWVYLHVLYNMGAAGKARGWIIYMGWETYNRLQSWLTNPTAPNPSEISVIGGGFLFTISLMIMRIRFIWWPLHPAGFALTAGGKLGLIWFPAFIAWFMKLMVLRFGGAKRFRQVAPFFLGLILGDYTVGCLWSIFGIILKMPTYTVWH